MPNRRGRKPPRKDQKHLKAKVTRLVRDVGRPVRSEKAENPSRHKNPEPRGGKDPSPWRDKDPEPWVGKDPVPWGGKDAVPWGQEDRVVGQGSGSVEW